MARVPCTEGLLIQQFGMALPGGSADKIGNRFEAWWTVHQIALLLDEKIDSIWLEPLGDDSKGVEFKVSESGVTNYHQVKRQQSTKGAWSLRDLARMGILTMFKEKVSSTSSCTFVSTQSAHPLAEMRDRVQQSSSLQNFLDHYLTSEQLRKAFSDLKDYWRSTDDDLASDETVYFILDRIRIVTVDESTLKESCFTTLKGLFNGDPNQIAQHLFSWAFENVHKTVTAYELWSVLKQAGYERKEWGNSEHIIEQTDSINNRYTSKIRSTSILTDDVAIPRNETGQVLDAILSETPTNVIVSGAAGVGKSGVMLQLAEALKAQNIPLLAFRVDTLKQVLRPEDVGEQLGLAGSPALVLGQVAKDKLSVLLIDQLDSVSLASGRHSEFYDCIEEIMTQAQQYPQMRLVIGCRLFDLENDSRIQKLVKNKETQKVKVCSLQPAMVRQVIERSGFDARTLTERQLSLLSLPLHLYLFLEAARSGLNSVSDLNSERDLYGRFWDVKKRAVRKRMDSPTIEWAPVMSRICEEMSKHQRLSVSKVLIDDAFDAIPNAMASENVLIEDNNNYRFFHESFFDYAFAREFASSDKSLLELLCASEQLLFRRAQVRQILHHERTSGSLNRYYSDLSNVLTSPIVRYHIKQVVFSILRNLSDPHQEELNLLLRISNDDKLNLEAEVYSAMQGSRGWFELLDSNGLVESWIEDQNASIVDRGRSFLERAHPLCPDRVVDIVKPYVSMSGEWNDRIYWLTHRPVIESHRPTFDLLLDMIEVGYFDNRPPWGNADNNLVESQPDWAVEVLDHWIVRLKSLGKLQEALSSMSSYKVDGKWIIQAAEGAPQLFVKCIGPHIWDMLSIAETDITNKYVVDSIWFVPTFNREIYDFNGGIQLGVQKSFARLAESTPEVVREFVDSNRSKNSYMIHFWICKALTACSSHFADYTAAYLIEDERRFKIGYSDSPYWVSKELIEAITPFCSNNLLRELENCLLTYSPSYERSEDGYKRRAFGRAQYILLDAIKPARRSHAVQKRLQELYRKFGNYDDSPKGITGGFVGSPIPASSTEKMTDTQWLSAIRAYKGQHQDFLKGGSEQLASVLKEDTKKDPKRFAQLGLRLPQDVNPDYFNAILWGLSEVDLPPFDETIEYCLYCHSLPNRPCGRWITRPIVKLAKSVLPQPILELIEWYALEDPDPDRETWKATPNDSTVYYGGDVFTAGLNSVRGGVGRFIGELLNIDRLDWGIKLLRQLVDDPSLSVRSCVVESLLYLLNYDRDLAVQLFLELCETEDAKFLEAQTIERFLRYSTRTHFEKLEPILNRMLNADSSQTQTAGARQVCLASLYGVQTESLLKQCLDGTESMRMGIAEVYSTNVHLDDVGQICIQGLMPMFDDSSSEVRDIAARCFSQLDGNNLRNYKELCYAFIKSDAIADSSFHFFHALEETTANIPDIILAACERFVKIAGDDIGDIRTRRAGDSYVIRKLVFRAYSQSSDSDEMSRCLDIIDMLLQYRGLNVDQMLDDFER